VSDREKRPLKLYRCTHGDGFDRCSSLTLSSVCSDHADTAIQVSTSRDAAPVARDTRVFAWAAIALLIFLLAVSYMTTRHEINQQQTQEAS
jgi:hypothetical protein